MITLSSRLCAYVSMRLFTHAHSCIDENLLHGREGCKWILDHRGRQRAGYRFDTPCMCQEAWAFPDEPECALPKGLLDCQKGLPREERWASKTEKTPPKIQPRFTRVHPPTSPCTSPASPRGVPSSHPHLSAEGDLGRPPAASCAPRLGGHQQASRPTPRRTVAVGPPALR